MEILGVGGGELIVILLIALVVAGPQRMIRWSYVLGTYASKLRAAWSNAAAALQREFDEAGVDIQVPKDIPTRQNISKEINRAVAPYVQQMREPVTTLNQEISTVKSTLQPAPNGNDVPLVDKSARPPDEQPKAPADFGTWSASSSESQEGGAA
jgi:Sec-independent protein translocase protein TatA